MILCVPVSIMLLAIEQKQDIGKNFIIIDTTSIHNVLPASIKSFNGLIFSPREFAHIPTNTATKIICIISPLMIGEAKSSGIIPTIVFLIVSAVEVTAVDVAAPAIVKPAPFLKNTSASPYPSNKARMLVTRYIAKILAAIFPNLETSVKPLILVSIEQNTSGAKHSFNALINSVGIISST